MSIVTSDAAPTYERAQSISRRILASAWAMPSFRVGLFVFLALLLTSAIYPELSSISATKMVVKDKFLPPLFLGEKWTWLHPLGTDQLGRDMLLRCLIGLRYSLLIGVVTVALVFLIGCGLGLLAGFKGGWWDTIIMRITDAQLSIPMIILAITILGVTKPEVHTIIIVLALSGWPLYARVARSAAVTERGKEYVRGLRVLGAGDWRILLLYAAPNILPPIAFVAVLDVARMMIFEAILGFLGLGIQPPTPSFGSIISDSRKYLINAWWIATSPGVFLALALTSINLMGSALEKARNKIYGGA
ncbi:ABC transporter permease [Labrys portucalensis]|uniref:ABC transporter permease n=1 Tax=Labrys neptuniae TaxID=376174 RepID=A0ABV6ZL58_9HYPH